jgi:hypothetical protein
MGRTKRRGLVRRLSIRLTLFALLASGVGAVAPSLAAACGGFQCILAGSSANGSTAFIQTPAPLVPADTDATLDVYARSGGVTTLVTPGQINGNGPFLAIFDGASADGSIVFFETDEQLTTTDTDASTDVYQRSGGVTSLVSTNSAGSANGGFNADFDGASSDGSVVIFDTGEQLAGTDSDAQEDVYRRSGGVTTQVSTNTGDTANGSDTATFDGISADGSTVLFDTTEAMAASDLDSVYDLFKRSGTTTSQVSTNTAGNANAADDAFYDGASADGSTVIFETPEQMAAGDTDANYDLYQRTGTTTTLISTNTAGTNSGAEDANFQGTTPTGSIVFFNTSEALEASDGDSETDVYQRSGATTSQISTNTAGNANGAFEADFDGTSADGLTVFFDSVENLAANDTDAESQRDLYQRSGGVTTLVSTNTAGNANGDLSNSFDGASADGSKVFFDTDEELAGTDTDGLGHFDIFQRSGGVTSQVSTNTAGTANGDFDSEFRGASTDGAVVFFITDEPLAAGDTDTDLDVYQRSGGTTTLVSTGNGQPVVNPPPPAAASPTGQRAAALSKCKKKFKKNHSKKKLKSCKKKANLLPV